MSAVPAGLREEGPTAALALLRVLGAGLLAGTAAIHAYLYAVGYSSIPTIGALFLLDAVAASALCLVVLAASHRFSAAAAGIGALLELGTLGGLLLATGHSLFGFTESSQASLYWQSVAVEAAGAVVLVGLAVVTRRFAGGARTR